MAESARKVSDSQIAEAYAELGNVWLAGERLGVSGQTVSRRMKAAGISGNKRWMTDADRAAIRAFYIETLPADFNLDVLADRLGRTRQMISREARSMGLTDQSRVSDRARANIKAGAAGRWDGREHPRGFLGGSHTEAAKAAISGKSRLYWSTVKTFFPEQIEAIKDRMAFHRSRMPRVSAETSYSRSKSGRRDDIGPQFFRSSWEANYARYLNLLMKLGVVEWWIFEPKTFWFEGYKRGVMSYLPDFQVKYKADTSAIWVEVKGWETPKDRTKWKRFAKQYPTEKLEIVGAKQYRALTTKWATAIPNWEGKK